MDLDFSLSLITCPKCNIVFQYYDFLSHNTHACNSNNNSNSDNNISYMETEINEDQDQEEDEEEDQYQDHTMQLDNRIINLNGLNDYGNYGNLYNPMINRNFQNQNSDISNLTDSISNININNGLDKIQLLNNSKKIHCNKRTECSICLVSYPEYTTFYLMNCNHSFCIECCEKWYSTNSLCPLCRALNF